MKLAVRSIRTPNLAGLNVFPSPLTQPNRMASAVKFSKITSSSNPDNKHDMDKAQNPNKKTGDVMSHSFGDGYATRSDEEGFGGIYGGNQSISKVEIDKEIHENHPAYDKSQGSEVKEKEKGRHQTDADA